MAVKEASDLLHNPTPSISASPLEEDLYEWHFTISGPPDSPFSQGLYHGRIILPPSYPLRPPSFRFLTPSGRFEVNREICLSISGFHEETWQPAWGVRTALVALRAFMDGDKEDGDGGGIGGMKGSEEMRVKLATESRGWKCSVKGCFAHEKTLGELEMKSTEEGRGTGEEKGDGGGLKFGYKDVVDRKRDVELRDRAVVGAKDTIIQKDGESKDGQKINGQTMRNEKLTDMLAVQGRGGDTLSMNTGSTSTTSSYDTSTIDKAIFVVSGMLGLLILRVLFL